MVCVCSHHEGGGIGSVVTGCQDLECSWRIFGGGTRMPMSGLGGTRKFRVDYVRLLQITCFNGNAAVCAPQKTQTLSGSDTVRLALLVSTHPGILLS